jgi:hypothetical protein
MSMADVALYLVLAAVGVVVFLAIRSDSRKEKEVKEMWRRFAESRALKEEALGELRLPRFTGVNRGFPFALEMEVTSGDRVRVGRIQMSAGDKTHAYTVFKVSPPGMPAGLKVYKGGVVAQLAEKMGMGHVETGDAAFDKAFTAAADDANEAAAYLTPERRALLMGALEDPGIVEIEGGELVLMKDGKVDDVMEMERLFEKCGEMASALAGGR